MRVHCTARLGDFVFISYGTDTVVVNTNDFIYVLSKITSIRYDHSQVVGEKNILNRSRINTKRI